MITRLLIPSVALALLAGPAAAQTRDTAANTALAILDQCQASLKGGESFDSVMTRRGFQRGSGGNGWVSGVGTSVISASTGTNTLRNGGQVKLCAVTLSPAATDKEGLAAAIATRARPWNLKYMSPGPGNGGGVMSGWANLDGQGLIGITINDAPPSGRVQANTTLSVMWR